MSGGASGRRCFAASTARAASTRAFASLAVTEVRDDSRLVQPGDLFVAVPGTAADGRQFVADAAARGAAALVVQEGGAEPPPEFPGRAW